MRKITLDLPEETYTRLERTAAAEGQTIDTWLQERLRQLVPPAAVPDVAEADADPAFWQLPDIDAEWAALESGTVAEQKAKPEADETNTATVAMLQRWFGGRMTEAEALELAMADDIHEWNLDQ